MGKNDTGKGPNVDQREGLINTGKGPNVNQGESFNHYANTFVYQVKRILTKVHIVVFQDEYGYIIKE